MTIVHRRLWLTSTVASTSAVYLPTLRFVPQGHGEVDQQPVAVPPVRAHGAHDLPGDHGPRRGPSQADRWQDPWLLLLSAILISCVDEAQCWITLKLEQN